MFKAFIFWHLWVLIRKKKLCQGEIMYVMLALLEDAVHNSLGLIDYKNSLGSLTSMLEILMTDAALLFLLNEHWRSIYEG